MCRHKMKYLPPWKSRKNQDVTDMLLRDQATTIARESMGVVSDEGNSIIEKEFIDRWFDNMERYRPLSNERAPTVLIAVDPNGSCSPNASEMAIVSMAMKWNANVVSIVVVFFWNGSAFLFFFSLGKRKKYHVFFFHDTRQGTVRTYA